VLHLLPELVRTILMGRITVRYPFASWNPPANFRGKLIVDEERCVGCGRCARDCPAQGLELIRQDRQQFQLIHHRDRCAYCGECEDSCRSGAIRFADEFPQPSPARASLTETLVARE
jgi:formate hydrogenlyase subunit 6/NADH:ubiquinone oxidoreductase subunit I